MLNNLCRSLCNDEQARTQSLDLSVDWEPVEGGMGDTWQERYYHSNLHWEGEL